MCVQEVAVRNCLHVLTYCPTVSEDIFSLLIKKMVNIDVSIAHIHTLTRDSVVLCRLR